MSDIMWIVPGRFKETLGDSVESEFMQSCLTAFVSGMQMNGLQPEHLEDKEFADSVVGLIEGGMLEMGIQVQDHATVIYMASPFSDAEPQPIAELAYATEH